MWITQIWKPLFWWIVWLAWVYIVAWSLYARHWSGGNGNMFSAMVTCSGVNKWWIELLKTKKNAVAWMVAVTPKNKEAKKEDAKVSLKKEVLTKEEEKNIKEEIKNSEKQTIKRSTPISDATIPDWFMYMRANELIIHDEYITYPADEIVKRRDLLWVLQTYAQQQNMKRVEWSVCEFNDIADLTEAEQGAIVDVCSYEFLRWGKGDFMPDREVTQAEMLAMVIRWNYGYLNEKVSPWWNNYYQKWVSLWLVKANLDKNLFNEPVTKKDVWVWLYAADDLKTVEATNLLTK